MKKRWISLLLVFAMVAAMLPQVAIEARAVQSGTCGDNLTWTLDDEGTLTIRGTGAMTNYDYDNSPWYYNDSIYSVIIKNGVTTIGDCAFFGCTGLTSVTIPNSVTYIGHCAFENCVMTSMTIPNSVTFIGNAAFWGCDRLTSVTIPNSVTSIGDHTFELCTSLASATIPDSVTSIGDSAFECCNSLTSMAIPGSVTYIGDAAFCDCDSLTSVTIPDSVTYIGDEAFSYCDSLIGIWVDENNPSYSSDAAGILFDKEQTDIIQVPKAISGKYTVPSSVTSIGSYAFSECDGLTGVNIPCRFIDKYAFYSCSNLAEVSLPESFYVGEYAFSECDSLEDVYYAGSEYQWGEILNGTLLAGNNKLYYATIHFGSDGMSGSCGSNLTYVLDDWGELTISGTGEMINWKGYMHVPWYKFRGRITSINIADGVTSIGDYAFYDCYNLAAIDLPANITTIGDSAFDSCTHLRRITLPDGLKQIQSYAFSMCDRISSISIPDSVTDIGYRAFFASANLKRVKLPSNITSIDSNSFQLCPSLDQVKIPNGVTTIDIAAFSACTSLASISIPVSVRYIKGCAFSECSALSDIYYAGTKEQWDNVYKDDYDNEPLFNATVHYESEMPPEPTDPTDPEYNSLWIDEHLYYANSEDYQQEITPGFTGELDNVFCDIMDDPTIKAYNLLGAVSSFLNAAGDADESELYQLILAEILYSRTNENVMSEIYANHLQKDAIKLLEYLANSEEVVSAFADSENYDDLLDALDILRKVDIGSGDYSKAYASFMNTLKGNVSMSELKTSLSKNATVTALSIGLDLLFEDMKAVEDITQYVINCMAYKSTSEEFKEVMYVLAAKAATVTGDANFPALTNYDGEIDWEAMCDAINEFVDALDAYEQKGMEAIAEEAVRINQEADVAFTKSAVKKLGVLAFDSLIGCVPVLNICNVGVKAAVSGGELLIKFLTDVDECAYSLEMMVRIYCFSVMMDRVTEEYVWELTEDNYTAASLFDESVSVYRSVAYQASEYGVTYVEAKLKDALSRYRNTFEGFENELTRAIYLKDVEGYTNSLVKLKEQQADILSIQCHNPYLDYSPEAEPIDYCITDSKLYIAACPVRMIVTSEKHGQIAVLSDTEYIVPDGFEHLFHVFETEPGSGEFVKVAVVPDGYEVLLEGTGNGTMDAAVIEYRDGVMKAPEYFYDIPVSKNSEGHFTEVSEETNDDELLFDNTTHIGETVNNPFADVPTDSFYYIPVLWALENNITTGATETTFNPTGDCLRAQVVTFLWRAAGEPKPTSTHNPFVDVKPSDFYYDAVLWAVENGITNGADATHFNPMGVCNRAQVVTFLYRTFHSPAVENGNNPFTDVPAGTWYTEPILWAVENGVTNGLSATQFGPNTNCNRAQIVTFLYRAYN